MSNARPNPYVGPRSFETNETLYGRDRELRMLSAQLISERIVLMHSPSGAGKTSLIQAGLVPLMRAEKFHVLPVARVNFEPPAELVQVEGFNRYTYSVIAALEEELPPEQRRPLAELAALTLDEYLSTRPRPAEAPRSDLLLFDQFEEILTAAPVDREGKQAFFAQLGVALRNTSRWALFAMREDYLGAIAPYVRPLPNRFEATFRLDLLGVKAATDAIQRPAGGAGVDFTNKAAAKLADDLRRVQVQAPDGRLETVPGEHIEPVQLQVVCFRLWQSLSVDDTHIDLEDIAAVGDVDQSLAEYYAQSVVNAAQQTGLNERTLREWFEGKLITREGVRGQVLMGAEASDGLDNRAVRLLEDAHIIRGEKRAGATWFELAHDRMIQPVKKDNAAWFEHNLSLFQRQAVLWNQQGRGEGLLLRGRELQQAEQEAETLQLTTEEQNFLGACRVLRKREQRDKRQRQFIVAGLVASLVFLALAITGYIYAKQQVRLALVAKAEAYLSAAEAEDARATAVANEEMAKTAQAKAEAQKNIADEKALIARAGELAALSVERRDQQPLLSNLLGVEAFAIVDNFRTRSTLLGNLHPWSILKKTLYPKSPVNSLVFSPDGKMLASGNEDNTITLWNVLTGQSIGQPLTGHTSSVWSVAFSPDGKILASGSYGILDGSIILWDISSGLPIGQPLTGHTSSVHSVAFSPDGQTLASGGGDSTIILWDMATRKPIGQPLVGHTSSVHSVAFSPDGQTLASGSGDNTIILWDVATRKPIGQPLVGHAYSVSSVVFSPDGKTLVSGSEDGSIIIWNVMTGQSIGQLISIGETPTVMSIAFSPDGQTLASGSLDGAIVLWDVAMRQPIGEPLTEPGIYEISSVTFDPSGKTLASSSHYNETIHLWDVDSQSWVEKTCQQVERNFTHAEWEQYGFTEPYRATCPQRPIEPEVTSTPTP